MFRAVIDKGFNKTRLRWLLALFFLALAIPMLILIYQANSQLKWEAFHQHRIMAEESAARIDGRLIELFDVEEARSFADYNFLVLEGDASSNFLQRSPLSAYPVESAIPGVLSYFQVDAGGTFSTPLLPRGEVDSTTYGISGDERAQRFALEQRILRVLSENRLVRDRANEVGTASGIASADPVADDRDAERDEARSRFAPDFADDAQRDAAKDKAVSEIGKSSEVARRLSRSTSPGISSPRITAQVEAEPAGASAEVGFDQLASQSMPAEHEEAQAQNALGRVTDLRLDSSYETKSRRLDEMRRQESTLTQALQKRMKRKEQSILPASAPQSKAELPSVALQASGVRVTTFESEIDPFNVSRLDGGQFVMYRNVWREGRRLIQGAVIDARIFLQSTIEVAFRETVLARMSNLLVAYQGNLLDTFSGQTDLGYLRSAQTLDGALLYQTRLSAPLDGLELIFSINSLPSGPGGTLIKWVALILVATLCGGFLMMYRFGVGQVELARQQQDFVSAVSHELKTPLTSIRMYGEMLRAGWADEEKKKTYYDFIYDESERLSRLITNVLQLARLTRNDPQFDLKPVSVSELMDIVRSKIETQVERTGFELRTFGVGDDNQTVICVDTDCFTQIIINLVDNAIKFSAKAEKRMIEVGVHLRTDGRTSFTVRDFGPGVAKDQMKKIFKLFYRSESELTRETVGTGIGLALVHQLAIAMDAKVDVRNCDPGAEFSVSFPVGC